MTRSNYHWDIFLCHAREDRIDMVDPLYEKLDQLGLRVWLDRFCLRTGQNQIKRVRNGLNNSLLVVLIASNDSLKKSFPIMEIGGAFFSSEDVYDRLYPICYNIAPKDLISEISHFGAIHAAEINFGSPDFEKKLDIIANEINLAVRDTKTELKEKRKQEFLSFLKPALIGLLAGALALFGVIFFSTSENGNTESEINTDSSSRKIDSIEKSIPSSDESPAIATIKPTGNFHRTEQFDKRVQPRKEDKIDFSHFINNISKVEVSVVLLSPNMRPESSLSNAVAQLYEKAGKRSSIGLFKSSFFREAEFEELIQGNSDVIRGLNLSEYVDYLVVGKMSYSSRQGSLVSGTIICALSMETTVINSVQKTISTFTVTGVGNGVSEAQAKDAAEKNLLNKYADEHSKL